MATSPDLRGYVDLSPYDRSASDLITQVLDNAATRLPGWVPRAGNTEVVLAEALVLPVMETVFAVNRLPGAVVEALLLLYGVERSAGTPPTGTVVFTVADDAGYTVPAGTVLGYAVGAEYGVLTFTTDVDLVIAAGATTGAVAVTGEQNTDLVNGLVAGTDLDLISSVHFVNDVEVGVPFSGGTYPEEVADWLDRGVERLRRLVSTLVAPAHFTAAALEEVDVHRATTLDQYDPGQAGNPGDHIGHVTVAVLGSGGAVLSADRKTAIETVLEDAAYIALDVHVIDPTITTVPVTATVRRRSGFTDAAVTANVTAAIEGYLDPDAWNWNATVRRNELIALIDGADGVDYVVDLVAPAADVALAGVAPLADAGAIAVTVTAP